MFIGSICDANDEYNISWSLILCLIGKRFYDIQDQIYADLGERTNVPKLELLDIYKQIFYKRHEIIAAVLTRKDEILVEINADKIACKIVNLISYDIVRDIPGYENISESNIFRSVPSSCISWPEWFRYLNTQ